MFVHSSQESPAKNPKKRLKRVQPTANAFVGEAEAPAKSARAARASAAFADNATEAADQKTSKVSKSISYLKVLSWVLIFGALGFMYLAHVRTTNDLLKKRNQTQLQYESAKHRFEELQRSYELTISPGEIYEKARANGYQHAQPKDLIIRVPN